MKRRDPTRIELKLDDIQEYEQMKREIEMKKNPANDTNNVSMDTANGDANNAGKSRTEIIHKRIGYDPTPKM